MVLATILQCSLMIMAVEEPNAADAWRDYFQQIENEDYPRDYDFEWTDREQSRYEEIAPLIAQAKEIASIEHCDWELDYSEGLNMLVPHFSQLREVQSMIRFSMYGDVKNGHTSSAIDAMNSLLDMTQHNNTTKTIIGSLVTASAFSMAIENEFLIDSASDLSQLDAMYKKVNSFDAFDPFGIRQNVCEEHKLILNWLHVNENPNLSIITSILNQADVDISGWDMDQEIENYSATMKKMEAIFQIPDEKEAKKAAIALEQDIVELGKLTELLSISTGNLLDAAFRANEKVAHFKELLEQKIEMLRNPNSATYFLRAVEAYNELDAKDRMNAVQHGDFTLFEGPFTLFTKACSLPPKRMTLAGLPETPHWIAPLYSLALDCISRGTTNDRLAIMEFVGHLSQQDRFAASILAAKLFDYDWGSTPEPDEPHLRAAFERAKKQIPSADEFMLHGSAESERQRLLNWYDMEESWDPNDTNTLAMTFTLAKLKGVDQHNPEAWKLFIKAVGIPDTHPSFLFAEENYNPELIEFLKLPQEESFDETIEKLSSLIGRVRYLETNSRER